MIAKWSGGAWSALGSDGAGNGAYGINSYVTAVAVFNGDVYASAGGPVNVLGGGTRSGLVRYTGGAWTDVGDWQYGANALVVSGGLLYLASGGVWRWDGGTWTQLGTGAGAITGEVLTLAVSGSTVYAGGYFQNAGGIAAADYVAKWNGSAWSAMGASGTGNGVLSGQVYALAISGSDVYVGGYFYTVGGNPADQRRREVERQRLVRAGLQRVRAAPPSAAAMPGPSSSPVRTFSSAAPLRTPGGSRRPTASRRGAWSRRSSRPRRPSSASRTDASASALAPSPATTSTTPPAPARTAPDRPSEARSSATASRSRTTGRPPTGSGSRRPGSRRPRYTVAYYYGATNITTRVVAGTYMTSSLAPGAAWLVTARVTVRTTATLGSSVTRLVTISSVGSPTRKDAVKFIAKRK